MPDEIKTDPALWERFLQGDGDAFEAVFREYQDEIYGRILRLVRDRGAAEDLTIETFWRIYRSRFRFDPERSFGAWAGRIAANVAIGYLKRRKRHGELTRGSALMPGIPADYLDSLRTFVRRVS